MDDYNFGTFQGVDENGFANFGKSQGIPRFYARSVPDPVASREHGTPMVRSADYLELLVPGERDVVDREVKPEDMRRWPAAWKAYQEGREQTPDGTPLSMLFLSNPEIVEHLRVHKFHTVEQLAEASDSALQEIPMGAYQYKAKALRFLEGRGDASKFAKLEQAIEQLTYSTKELQEQNRELRKALATKAEAEADEPAPSRRR